MYIHVRSGQISIELMQSMHIHVRSCILKVFAVESASVPLVDTLN